MSTGQLVSDQQLNDATQGLSAAQNRVATLKAQLDQLRRGAFEPGHAGGDAVCRHRASAAIAKARWSKNSPISTSNWGRCTRNTSPSDGLAAPCARADWSGGRSARTGRARGSTSAPWPTKASLAEQTRCDEVALARRRQNGRPIARTPARGRGGPHRLRQLPIARQGDLRAIERRYAANARVITRGLRPQQSSWPPYRAARLRRGRVSGLLLGASGSSRQRICSGRSSCRPRRRARSRMPRCSRVLYRGRALRLVSLSVEAGRPAASGIRSGGLSASPNFVMLSLFESEETGRGQDRALPGRRLRARRPRGAARASRRIDCGDRDPQRQGGLADRRRPRRRHEKDE